MSLITGHFIIATLHLHTEHFIINKLLEVSEAKNDEKFYINLIN